MPQHVRGRSLSSGCFTLADYSEFCLYQDACWVSGKVHLRHVPVNVQKAINEIDNFLNLPPVSGSFEQPSPARLYPSRSFLAPSTIIENKDSKGLDESKFIGLGMLAAFDSDSENPFHFSEKFLLLHAAQQLNGSFLALDSLAQVMLMRPKPSKGGWIDGFVNALLPPGSSLKWSQDLDQLTSPICFAQLLIPGTVIHLVQGIRDAEALRQKVYASISLSAPLRRKRPPRSVLFVRRKSRSFTNHDELVLIINSYGVPCKSIFLGDLTFAEQVKEMSSAGILITPHGAGLTNIIWMSTGATVIEAFTSREWHYNLYGEIAHNAGLFHIAITGRPSLPANRLKTSAFDCFQKMSCILKFKNLDFAVDPAEFRHAFERALSITGLQ